MSPVSAGRAMAVVRLIATVSVVVAAMVVIPTVMSLAAVAGLTVSAVTMFCFLLTELYSRSGFRSCRRGA